MSKLPPVPKSITPEQEAIINGATLQSPADVVAPVIEQDKEDRPEKKTRARRQAVEKEKVSTYVPKHKIPDIDRAADKRGISRNAYINLAIFNQMERDGI